jgi:hypothetical protein
MRLPPGAVTKRIYGPGIEAECLDGGIGATLGIASGFPPGAVTKRICESGMAAGCLDGTIEGASGIDAVWSTGATGIAIGLPHMMQVSVPWTRSPLHLTQCFIIEIPHQLF